MSSSSASRGRRWARSTPARRCRRWPRPSPKRSSTSLSAPTSPGSSARAPPRLVRGRDRVGLLTGEPEYLDPLKAEAPEGWIVTGYPWIRSRRRSTGFPRGLSGASSRTIRAGLDRRLTHGRRRRVKKAGSTDPEKIATLKGLTRARRSARSVPRARPPVDHGRLRRQASRSRTARAPWPTGIRRRRRLPAAPTRSKCASGAPAASEPARRVRRRAADFLVIQLLNGLASASSLFLVVGRPVADLRRDADRQLRPRLVLHAGPVRRLQPDRGAGPHAGGLLERGVLAALAVGLVGVPDRNRWSCAASTGARAVPAARHLRASCWSSRTRRSGVWGPEDLVGPRAPGLRGRSRSSAAAFPAYDLLLIVVGPVVLGLLWLLLTKTRWGTLVRAATQDREMVGGAGRRPGQALHLGVLRRRGLAGLGGALQIPREPANLDMDLSVIADAFVVDGGRRHRQPAGAFLAAVLIGVSRRSASLRLLQAHPGRRVRGHGGGAGGAALRPARQAAGAGARRRRDRAPPARGRRRRWPVAAWLALSRSCRCSPATATSLVLLTDIAGLRAVRRQPAFHHGAGRHGVVRPRRLFRPRRLCRRRCCSRRPACRWSWRCAGAVRRRPVRRWSSAGSACACRASISRC